PGVSSRWAITSGTSLQATLNPDFSQVEADAAQLDVNRRFALSFPEKRPFFLEGSDFFETQLPLLFTRSIADPVAGIKLTGKSGANAYGVLLARDRITNLLVPSDQSSFRTTLPEDSTTAVLRYRREIGKKVTVGTLVSSRSGPGYDNRVASADTYLRLTERDSLRVQFADSQSNYPDAIAPGTLRGHGFLAIYSHSDRNWTWGGNYQEYSPKFRADAGLFDQVGIRYGSGYAERRIRGGTPGRTWFSNLYFSLGGDTTRQYDGDWTEWGADLVGVYQGPRQSSISINFLAPNQEFFAGRVYHNLRHNFSASIQATRDLRLGLSSSWGEQIDFTNERPADFVTLSPSATFDVGRRIHGELSWQHQTFKTEAGDRVFTADVPQARLLYHFSRRAFLRTILQYRDVQREPDQYVVPVQRENRSFLSQVLFSYRVDAQTVFLAGYSDNYAGTDQLDLTRLDRTLFVKLSYAWLF
ncbi:MAG TPA: DUF5916 domain-containing protein, partial [Thermoanaerobaculia bacterium]|nr:DUF5916 domain-containing protein [Thermoanaerobaculia bacterium]